MNVRLWVSGYPLSYRLSFSIDKVGMTTLSGWELTETVHRAVSPARRHHRWLIKPGCHDSDYCSACPKFLFTYSWFHNFLRAFLSLSHILICSQAFFPSKNLLSPDGNQASYHHFPKIYGLCSLKNLIQHTQKYTSSTVVLFSLVLLIYF